MGRPHSDLDEYLDWQERLESFDASGLEIDVFCLKEGVSRSTFYRWKDRLKEGIPESMVAEKAVREKAESVAGSAFVNDFWFRVFSPIFGLITLLRDSRFRIDLHGSIRGK